MVCCSLCSTTHCRLQCPGGWHKACVKQFVKGWQTEKAACTRRPTPRMHGCARPVSEQLKISSSVPRRQRCVAAPWCLPSQHTCRHMAAKSKCRHMAAKHDCRHVAAFPCCCVPQDGDAPPALKVQAGTFDSFGLLKADSRGVPAPDVSPYGNSDAHGPPQRKRPRDGGEALPPCGGTSTHNCCLRRK